MGSFICKNCGKEFAHYNNLKQEKGRKYCKECAKILKNGTIKRYCKDCGIELKRNIFTKRVRERCHKCQYERELKASVEYMAKKR